MRFLKEVVEKPVKKVATETFDTAAGVNKMKNEEQSCYGETPEVTPGGYARGCAR